MDELILESKMPKFKVKDHKGFDVSERNIIGITALFFFFPQGDPSLAQAFAPQMDTFDLNKTLVVGISTGNPQEHLALVKKYKIPFTLLSDENREMSRSFGVIQQDKMLSSTFVFDRHGLLKWMEKPVELKGHVERALEAVEKHFKSDAIRFDDYNRDYENFFKSTLQGPSEKKIRKEILKKYQIKEPE